MVSYSPLLSVTKPEDGICEMGVHHMTCLQVWCSTDHSSGISDRDDTRVFQASVRSTRHNLFVITHRISRCGALDFEKLNIINDLVFIISTGLTDNKFKDKDICPLTL